MKEDNFIRLTYEIKDIDNYGSVPNKDEKMIWETKFTDSSADDIIRALYSMMINATWQPHTILCAMQDFVLENKDSIDLKYADDYYWLKDSNQETEEDDE